MPIYFFTNWLHFYSAIIIIIFLVVFTPRSIVLSSLLRRFRLVYILCGFFLLSLGLLGCCFLGICLIIGWVIPILSSPGREDIIESSTEDVDTACDVEHYPPLSLCWLKFKFKSMSLSIVQLMRRFRSFDLFLIKKLHGQINQYDLCLKGI